jgi:Flp pilus assembly protein TadG
MAATASKPGHTLALLKDELGATISEFAVVAPVFLLMMMGTFDAAHTMYVRAVMQGAVYKAARETALKAGQKELQQISILSVPATRILLMRLNRKANRSTIP